MDPELAGRRLFFPARTPAAPGIARLRCNVYHRQVLLQSRVVEARVDPEPTASVPGALRSVADYTISRTLDPGALAERSPYVASLMLNDDDAGTHSVRVLAADGGELLHANIDVSEADLGTRIRLVRECLRRVAWGTSREWTPEQEYRYGAGQPAPDWVADLADIAATGHRLYQLLLRSIARGSDGDAYQAGDRLAAALRQAGYLQVALKESASHMLPAAALYDYPLSTTAATITLCPDADAAIRAGAPLGSTACFADGCRWVAGPAADRRLP